MICTSLPPGDLSIVISNLECRVQALVSAVSRLPSLFRNTLTSTHHLSIDRDRSFLSKVPHMSTSSLRLGSQFPISRPAPPSPDVSSYARAMRSYTLKQTTAVLHVSTDRSDSGHTRDASDANNEHPDGKSELC